MTAVKQNGFALQYCYRGENRKIVLCAIRQTGGRAFEYAGPMLRCNDREIVLEAVTRNGFNLQHTSWDFQDDYDVVLAAVKQTPYAFEYAGLQARAYKDIVLEAVRRKGSNLQYTSMELRNDREIVEAAIEVCWRAGYYRGANLQDDSHIFEKMRIARAKQDALSSTSMV